MEPLRYTNKSVENGISEKEALLRQKEYGLNEIKSKNVNAINILLRQFKSPFFYLLFIAAIIAFLVGEIIDGFIILFFILINVSLGFFQEARAQKATSLLKKFIPSKTRVLRKGEEKTIDKKHD